MNGVPATSYFVRVRGRVQGPFELSRLKELRARGQFSRIFEVSEDGRHWVSSESLADLFDPPTPPSAPAPEPEVASGRGAEPQMPFHDAWDDGWKPRKRKSDSSLGTILLILLLIVVPAGLVGGIVLLQRLESGRVLEEVDEPVDSTQGTATFEYWSDFKEARRGLEVTSSTPASQIASQFRRAADRMSALPTLGVDPEAVQLVLDYSAALTGVSGAIEQSNSPETYLEAFLRGADGDPFGKALELKNSKDAAVRQLADVEQRMARVRAALTATYARQFP